MSTKRRFKTLVIAGGQPPSFLFLKRLASLADAVVTVDRGLNVAHKLGLSVSLHVGDGDSASAKALKAAKTKQSILLSSEKSVSDLEYALDILEAGAGTVVVGAHRDHEGRTDHLFINLLILAKRRGVVFADDESWVAPLVSEKMVLCTKRGVLLTVAPLIPGGIRLKGTQYRFNGERTTKHVSEGLSNRVTSKRATVSVQKSALVFVGESLLESRYSISALR